MATVYQTSSVSTASHDSIVHAGTWAACTGLCVVATSVAFVLLFPVLLLIGQVLAWLGLGRRQAVAEGVAWILVGASNVAPGLGLFWLLIWSVHSVDPCGGPLLLGLAIALWPLVVFFGALSLVIGLIQGAFSGYFLHELLGVVALASLVGVGAGILAVQRRLCAWAGVRHPLA